MRTEVVVVGAGPVGLMLAGELRLGGVEVIVCEQLETPSGEARGVGFTRRAAEVFDQRGLLSRLGEIEIGRELHFGGVRIDPALLDDDHFGVRGVPQHRVEAMLEAWVGELGGVVLRGHRVAELAQSATGVTVGVVGPSGPFEITADYLVGCDGARSTVRRLAGVDFPGRPATRGMYVAEIAGCDIRPRPIGERVPGGMVMSVHLDGGLDRIVILPDALLPQDVSELTFADIADSWQSLTGQSLHAGQLQWMNAFTDTARQAARYRQGRILLAGDAAHIHLPAGAQGLSVGIQDAMNLGWKLATTIRGWAPEELLDTYHDERHPVGAQVLANTQAQGALYLAGDEMEPIRRVLRELVEYPEVARQLVGKVSGLDIRYDMHVAGQPLLGYRMPTEWQVELGGERSRVAELLHPGRGVLIDTRGDITGQLAGWFDRVDAVLGRWVGHRTDERQRALQAVLIRPDGYVAWAHPGSGDLRTALQRWFGLARTRQPSNA